jgi:hypothetical protein
VKVIAKKKRHWLIALEQSERPDDIVEAWARASFELAKPTGISALTSYNSQTQWEDVRSEALKVRYSTADPSCILQMDYVAGRRCKTTIRRGRKYLTIYPGDDRKQDLETMYLLAIRYLAQGDVDLQNVAFQADSVQ